MRGIILDIYISRSICDDTLISYRGGYEAAHWREHARPSCRASSAARARTHVKRRELGLAALAGAATACLGGWGRRGEAAGAPCRPLGIGPDVFPALNQYVRGRPLIYLDSAATTQRPSAVLDAIDDFYRRDNANPGPAFHELARRANARYESARSTLAGFLNASSAEEIVWVRGTTEGINLVASSWASARLRPGDEILLTVAEHTSNLLPWRLAADAIGAKVRCVDVDEEGRISLQDLSRGSSVHARAFSRSATCRTWRDISIPPPRSARVRIARAHASL